MNINEMNKTTKGVKASLQSASENTAGFEKELKQFQRIQREGEYLKLRLKNRELMNQLGIKDRDDIFDNDSTTIDKSKKELKNLFLLSTFKSGKEQEKAKVFISGKGVRIIKSGDYITNDVKVIAIKNGHAKLEVIPYGDIYDMNQLGVF
ncbi:MULTISPECIES: hypothetical protein [unclassified Erwinia]|uniref:hypothetical protein n=1 Tax=unclassified Erwinia TaxID=2622719 RepID=UPI001177E9F7|nr:MULTISPECIES: hypothetical protein [unclassified Erwinia]